MLLKERGKEKQTINKREFVWEVWWGMIMTLDQVKKRGLFLLIDVMCTKKVRKA